jgi:hypothetical protein
MSKINKLIVKILSGKSDRNIKFADLCNLLIYIGFELRTKGSHHIFRLSGLKRMLNLQKDGDLAKEYQVKQVRDLLVENKLIGDLNE